MPTERECVLRERAAYQMGVEAMWIQRDVPDTAPIRAAFRRMMGEADQHYPLPKATRSRIVEEPGEPQYRYCVIDGEVVWDAHIRNGPAWKDLYEPDAPRATADRVRIWADLLADPTEEVDDE